MHFIWVSRYLARTTNWGHFLNISLWRLDCHFTWSSKPCKGLAVCRAKEAPSFLSYFKTLSIGPTMGKEPAISRSAVKSSTNWANPAAKCTCSLFSPQNLCKFCFNFLSGVTINPWEFENNLCKILWGRQIYCIIGNVKVTDTYCRCLTLTDQVY